MQVYEVLVFVWGFFFGIELPKQLNKSEVKGVGGPRGN